MSLKILILAILFIISGGSLFAETFRKNKLLFSISVLIATLSTYYLFNSIYEDILSTAQNSQKEIRAEVEKIKKDIPRKQDAKIVKKTKKVATLERPVITKWEDSNDYLFRVWNEKKARDIALKLMNAAPISGHFNGNISYKVHGFYHLNLSSGESYISLGHSESDAGMDCHACQAGISVIRFKKDENDWWGVESHSINAFLRGDWGQAPDMEVHQIGPNRYGVYLEDSRRQREWVGTSGELISELDGEWKTIFHILLFEDDTWTSGIGDGKIYLDNGTVYWSSKMSFIPEKEKEFFDILIKRTVLLGKLPERFQNQKKQIYTFNGSEYVARPKKL